MTTEPTTERLQEVLEDVHHCAALTSVIREHLGGASIDHREAELMRLSAALASRIFDFFWLEVPASCGTPASSATAVAGKLKAVIEVAIDSNARAAFVTMDAERSKLVERIGWMQNAADDLAEELVGLMHEISAKGVL